MQKYIFFFYYVVFLHFFFYLCRVKLSVIIPVYRVEHTLDRCVESVLRQDVGDMEVILVDDGSPDCCPQKCDHWASQDPRLRVIHKQNGGLSDARNAGIDVACGEFITFVDSDDWLSDHTYAPLMERMADCDLLEYSIHERLLLQDRVYTDVHAYWLQERAYSHTYACNKIYRRTLFDGVRYPKGKVFEDVYTLPLLLHKTSKLMTTSLGYYHYEWNASGISATADGAQLSLLLDAHLTSKMPVDDTYYMYLLNIQLSVCELSGAPVTLPPRHLNAARFSGDKKLKSIVSNIFGINILCKIIKIVHLFRKPRRM